MVTPLEKIAAHLEYRLRRARVQARYEGNAPSAADSLAGLANRYGSDKGTTHAEAHDYVREYAFLFQQHRAASFRMLEMGLQYGAQEESDGLARDLTDVPSVRMWLDYFPRAHIVGFDISDCSSLSLDRFTFVRGDGGNADDLRRLAEHGPFRIIVEDASHASYHQQLAIRHLFAALEPGGFFVLEDLHWQPPGYEAALPHVAPTREVLSAFAEGRSLVLPDASREESSALASEISNVFIQRRLGREGDEIKMVVLQKRG